jgi:hypothetical protein
MPDEPNASLDEIVTLLRRQVEQADSHAKRAEEAAVEERRRRATSDSQRVRVSRVVSLLLVTAVIAWGLGVSNGHTLQQLTDIAPADYVRKQIASKQRLSYTTTYIAMLVLGGLYFAVVDTVAFAVRRIFLFDK